MRRADDRGLADLGAADRVATLWALLALAVLLSQLIGLSLRGTLFAEDDAYYYMIVAKHLAATGRSTFDGQSLTNGYHPLWLLALTLQVLTVGPSLFWTFAGEAVLTAGSLWLILRRAPDRSPLAQGAFTIVYLALLTPLIMRGMEVSLALFGFALTIECAARTYARAGRGLVLGVAGAIAIGARIDAAVFVIPLLIAAPLKRRTRAVALSVILVGGLIYAGINQAVFGSAMPVSSTVKSLGGLQLNRPLIHQMTDVLRGEATGRLYWVTLLGLLACPVMWLFSRRGTLVRALTVAGAIGGAAYVAKLLFGSSWVIWSWYNFPIILPLTAGYFLVSERGLFAWIRDTAPPLAVFFTPLALAMLLAIQGAMGIVRPFRIDVDYAPINRAAVARYADLLKGQRVAMGDRAGSFANAYPGSVVQLEGLVNDVEYLGAVERGDDVRGLLCARGVAFLLYYQADPPRAADARLPIFHPHLTQARGPTVSVKADELAGDVRGTPAAYAGAGRTEHLTLWRLRCR